MTFISKLVFCVSFCDGPSFVMIAVVLGYLCVNKHVEIPFFRGFIPTPVNIVFKDAN